ncbi:TraB/GumN family protein [Phenylobacterium parvum]|uniref:TraB/GumN family protein n=1 Tax=Phenylobacterium parvum TaxID=2201350 RepID=A0A2Z3I397_9CAUL|nr:TraB/GumN family protein [Phenylobacterium parvum]AWM78228.1 TraB/GumN family protein [Phenylobacterium parvum]
MFRRLAASAAALSAALGLACTPALAAPRDADPALWVVRDADTTIYLFGTVHFLPKDLSWFDEAVADAFNASDELRMELLPVDDPASLAPLIMKLAVDPQGRTMAQKLTPEDHAAYVKAMNEVGLPAGQLEPLEPWFISVQAAAVMYMKAGMDPKSGSEEVLTQAARKSGKRITAFETPEQQFSMLDSTPEAEQLRGIRDIAYRRDESLAMMTRLIDHWTRGEADETGRLMNEEMKSTPETARILLTERNARWAKDLKARMDSPGAVFVAVGAGHLTGKDSVQDLLARDGLKVERVLY